MDVLSTIIVVAVRKDKFDEKFHTLKEKNYSPLPLLHQKQIYLVAPTATILPKSEEVSYDT